MFGFEDGGIMAAYLLAILGTILCVVYGLLKWNSED
jgi:hypothetical protein